MIEVNAVETVTDFGWVLTFSSGERWRFDMRPYLHYPVFHRLENPGFFSWLLSIMVWLLGSGTKTSLRKNFMIAPFLWRVRGR